MSVLLPTYSAGPKRQQPCSTQRRCRVAPGSISKPTEMRIECERLAASESQHDDKTQAVNQTKILVAVLLRDSIKDRGVTILMVEQKVKKALVMADKACVLQTGRITMSDTGRELLENPEIKGAYLGL